MKSSLLSQLNNLKVSQTDRNLHKNANSSLLFTFQQAANFDRDTIKSIAIQGLDNLINLEPSLTTLKDSLFSSQYDNLHRETLTAKQNEELTTIINHSIRDLSHFFLLEDCHKVFEYLIRNFQIQKYEAETLIVALMPYHSTVYYVKLLQNINLEGTQHWAFLEKNVKQGLVIPRTLLAKQAVLDIGIIEKITKMAIQVDQEKSTEQKKSSDIFFNVSAGPKVSKKQNHKNLEITFAMLLSIETISHAKERRKISDNLLISLIKLLSHCLKHENPDIFRSGLILALQVINTVPLTHQYLQAISVDSIKKFTGKNMARDVLLLQIYIHQNNESFPMPLDVYNEVISHPQVVLPIFDELSRKFSMVNFFIALYNQLCNQIPDSNNQDAAGFFTKVLEMIVREESQLAVHEKKRDLAILLLNKILSSFTVKFSASNDKQRTSILSISGQILTAIKTYLPDCVTEGLQAVLTNLESLQDHYKAIYQLLSKTFSRLYIENVLGIESENSAPTEFKEVISGLSPYSPSSLTVKTRLLENILGAVASEGKEKSSALQTVSQILSLHFKTASYNEKFLINLLESPVLNQIFQQTALISILITFVRSFFKLSNNKEISNQLLVHCFAHILSSAKSLNAEVQQLVKDFSMEHIFGNYASYLKDHLKTLKKIHPVVFKHIGAEALSSDQKSRLDILFQTTQSNEINDLESISQEAAAAQSELARENYLIVGLVQLKSFANRSNIGNISTFLEKLKAHTPINVQHFTRAIENLVKEISSESDENLLILRDLIEFLLRIQSTAIIPPLREIFNSFGQNKLISSVLILNSLIKKQDKFIIFALFISKIVETETFELSDSLHASLILISILPNLDETSRRQTVSILRTLNSRINHKELKNQSISSLRVINSHPFAELPFQSQDRIQGETPLLSSSVANLVKTILKSEIELIGVESSAVYRTIFERMGGEFSAFQDLASYLIIELYTLPTHSLFNLGTAFINFLNEKYSQKLNTLQIIKNYLKHSEQYIGSASSTELAEKAFKTISSLNALETDQTLAGTYVNSVLKKICKMCEPDNDFSEIVIENFPSHIFGLLAADSQLQVFGMIFGLSRKGAATSAVISKLGSLAISNNMLIEFGQDLVGKLSQGQEAISSLSLFSELLQSLGKNTIEFLGLFNKIYAAIVVEGASMVRKASYALSILINLHRRILMHVIVSKITIDYSREEAAKESIKPKKTVSLYSMVGEYIQEADSYEHVISLKNLVDSILSAENIFEQIDKFNFFIVLKESFGCLAVISYFLTAHISSILTETLMPLFLKIEDHGPKTQATILQFFSEIISVSSNLFENLNLHPYVPLLLKVLTLKTKLPDTDNTTIRSKNYHFIEIDKEINFIIQKIGESNLEFVIYAIINNLIVEQQSLSQQKKTKNLLQHTQTYDSFVFPAISVIFSSKKLENVLNTMKKLITNDYDLLSIYLQKALEIKKQKIFFNPSAPIRGKKITSTFGIKTSHALKVFIMINIDFWKRIFQSKEFINLFSAQLIKGAIKGEATQGFSEIIDGLFEAQELITQGITRTASQKSETDSKDPKENQKRVQLKNYLKKLLIFIDEGIQTFQELMPEDLLSLVCVKTIEGGVSETAKTGLLNLFYEKVNRTHTPKITVKSGSELKKTIEKILDDVAQEPSESLNQDHTTYLQSLLLTLNALIKKKPKIFDQGISQSLFTFTSHPIFELRCSAFYTLGLYNEKYSIKSIEKFPELVENLILSLALCLRANEFDNFERLKSFSHERNITHLSEILDKVQQLPEEDYSNLENCFLICLNSLALLIRTYKNMINPYIPSLLTLVGCIMSHEERIEESLDLLVKFVEPRNLIEPLGTATESQHHFSHIFAKRVAILLGNVTSELDIDTVDTRNLALFKTFLRGLDYARVIFSQRDDIDKQEAAEIEDVQAAWVDAFSKFAVKANELQLKKYFLKLNEWSSKAFAEEQAKFSVLRKIVVFELMNKLFNVIKSYFVQYMAFVFDFCLDQLAHYAVQYAEPVLKGSKRRRPDLDFFSDWECKLHGLILKTMTNSFLHDKDEFIDSNKFDKIVNPLIDQLDCIAIPCGYEGFCEEFIGPAILQLFELVNDDYKWKNLNYSLMMKTRSEIKNVRLATLKIALRVIEQLKERVAVLLNDILPFIGETLEDEDMEVNQIVFQQLDQVEKVSKEIAMKLEQITGENIKEYLK